MAFTGTPVIQMISESECRVTGVSLAGAAAGVIGLSGHAAGPDVLLPAHFMPVEYTGPDGTLVTLIESLDVTVKPAATGIATPVPIAVVKTGADPTSWIATVTNLTGGTASSLLEIYIKYKL